MTGLEGMLSASAIIQMALILLVLKKLIENN